MWATLLRDSCEIRPIVVVSATHWLSCNTAAYDPSPLSFQYGLASLRVLRPSKSKSSAALLDLLIFRDSLFACALHHRPVSSSSSSSPLPDDKVKYKLLTSPLICSEKSTKIATCSLHFVPSSPCRASRTKNLPDWLPPVLLVVLRPSALPCQMAVPSLAKHLPRQKLK